MSFAANILAKQHENLSWVVKIGTASPVYYASVKPASGLTCTAGIVAVELPERKMSALGGGAEVSQAQVDIQDLLMDDSTYSGTRNLHDGALTGKPIQIYLGYAADAWDGEGAAVNFKLQWQGYIASIPFADGLWSIKADDALSKAKGLRLPVLSGDDTPAGAAFFKIRDAYHPKDAGYNCRTRVGFPVITTPANVLTNGGFEAGSTAGWTAGANCASFAVGTTNPSPSEGSYRASFGCTASGVAASIYQDYALPAGHRPGMVYAVVCKLRRISTAGLVYGRVSLEGLKADGTQHELFHTTPRKLKNDMWGAHSASIVIYHPLTTKIRVRVHGLATGADKINVDDCQLVHVAYTASVKREIVSVLNMTENTSPNIMTIAHSVFNTRECNQAVKQKGQLCKVLGGFVGDVILRLLTTTSAGTNGAWDHGDGYGAGIPVAMLDTATFAGLRSVATIGALYKVALTKQGDIDDLLTYINDELLQPCALSMFPNSAGLITARFTPYTYTPDAAKALTDAKWAERPTIERKPEELVNRIHYLIDYDGNDACETAGSIESFNKGRKGKKKDLPTQPTEDTSYVGQWIFDERDYKMTGAYSDAVLTLLNKYGLQEITVKSEGLRSPVSYSAGMPCLLEYSAVQQHCQDGEMAGRAFAERVLGTLSTPPCFIEWKGYSELWNYEPGDVFPVTCAGLPDLSAAGGGMGITTVPCIVESVAPDPETLTATLLLRVVGWSEAIIQDAHSAGTNPSASTVAIAPCDVEGLNAGNFPWTLQGTYTALKSVQTYDGNQGDMPDFAEYAYTELRVDWSPSDAAGLGYSVVGRFRAGRYLTALHGVYGNDTDTLEDVNAQFYYRFKNGAYSTVYTVTGLSSDATDGPIAAPTLTRTEDKRTRNVYKAEWAENQNLDHLRVFKRIYSATPGTPDTDKAAWTLVKSINLVDVLIALPNPIELCTRTDATFGCNHADGQRINVAVQLVQQDKRKSNWVIDAAAVPTDSDDTTPAVPTLALASAVNDKTGTAQKECDLTVTATWVACHEVDIEVLEWDPSGAGKVVETFVHHMVVKGGTSPTTKLFKRLGEKGNTFYARVRGKVGTAHSAWSCADGAGAWGALPPVGAYSIAAGGATPLLVAPTATPQQGEAPLTVAFSAHASGGTGPYAYDWDYGDGSAHGTTATPSHVYALGSWIATLTVTDASGQRVTAAPLIIQVTTAVPGDGLAGTLNQYAWTGAANYTMSPAPTASASGGTAPYTYDWDWGDGSTHGSTATPGAHGYTGVATFNGICKITDADSAVVSVPFTVSATGTVGVTVTMNNSGAWAGTVPYTMSPAPTATPSGGAGSYSYDWDWGDGSAHYTTNGTPTAHQYTVAGTYRISVKVTDSAGSIGWGFATVNVALVLPLIAYLSAYSYSGATPYTLTPPTVTASGGVPAYTYDWDWGDGSAHGSTATPGTHVYSLAGLYYAVCRVTDTASGLVNLPFTVASTGTTALSTSLTGDAYQTFNEDASPGMSSVTINASGGSGTYEYEWEFMDGSAPVTTAASGTHVFSNPGTYEVVARVTDTVTGVYDLRYVVCNVLDTSGIIPVFTPAATSIGSGVSQNYAVSASGGVGTLSFRIVWGDGSADTTGTVTGTPTNYAHTYTIGTSYPIPFTPILFVTDANNNSVSKAVTVTVTVSTSSTTLTPGSLAQDPYDSELKFSIWYLDGTSGTAVPDAPSINTNTNCQTDDTSYVGCPGGLTKFSAPLYAQKLSGAFSSPAVRGVKVRIKASAQADNKVYIAAVGFIGAAGVLEYSTEKTTKLWVPYTEGWLEVGSETDLWNKAASWFTDTLMNDLGFGVYLQTYCAASVNAKWVKIDAMEIIIYH